MSDPIKHITDDSFFFQEDSALVHIGLQYDYDARDKFLSRVVGGRMASESLCNVCSWFVTDQSKANRQRNSSYLLRTLDSGDVINKSKTASKIRP